MRKLDAPTLKRSAVAYLGRYASSAANLRAVLKRKCQRWRRLNGGESDGDAALVDGVVEAAVNAGLVDDAAFAVMRTATLAHRGWPARRIAMGLSAKGVPREIITDALSGADDAAAALRFAERRRLGPWRPGDRTAKRDKDIAAMMRAGFPHGLARRTIDGAD